MRLEKLPAGSCGTLVLRPAFVRSCLAAVDVQPQIAKDREHAREPVRSGPPALRAAQPGKDRARPGGQDQLESGWVQPGTLSPLTPQLAIGLLNIEHLAVGEFA